MIQRQGFTRWALGTLLLLGACVNTPDLPLIPASTAKLATAVAALDVLGPEHRFRTELLTSGVIEHGVLRGDLILRGGGDPLLDLPDLLGLAVRLENTGIREVDGHFLIDDS